MSWGPYEARIREMAADRLQDATLFTSPSMPSASTALLLSMCNTLRACMRDWPMQEASSHALLTARLDCVEKLKSALQDLKSARKTSDDNLLVILAEALFIVAEQWPSASKHSERKKEEFDSSKGNHLTSPDTASGSESSFTIDIVNSTTAGNNNITEDEEPVLLSPNATLESMSSTAVAIDALFGRDQSAALEGLLSVKHENQDWDSGSSPPPTSIANEITLGMLIDPRASLPMRSFSQKPTEAKKHKYFCSVCGLGCVARTQLDSHMNIHTGRRPFDCSFCSKAYKRKDHLTDHLKKTHPFEYQKSKIKKKSPTDAIPLSN